MIITDVQALQLRQPDVDANIADGSQDALIVRLVPAAEPVRNG